MKESYIHHRFSRLFMFGFAVLTIVMYTFVLVELKKPLSRTVWDENCKRKIYNRVLYTLIGWTAFISALGLIGFFQDFSASHHGS